MATTTTQTRSQSPKYDLVKIPSLSTFQHNLDSLMARDKLNNSRLANLSGLSKSTVGRILNATPKSDGSYQISSFALEQISTSLKISQMALLARWTYSHSERFEDDPVSISDFYKTLLRPFEDVGEKIPLSSSGFDHMSLITGYLYARHKDVLDSPDIVFDEILKKFDVAKCLVNVKYILAMYLYRHSKLLEASKYLLETSRVFKQNPKLQKTADRLFDMGANASGCT